MRSRTPARIWAALGLLAPATPSVADTLRVPEDHARVADALAAATDGDVILVAPGTYSPAVNGESFPLLVSASVTLSGAGMGVSILDAQGQGSVLHVAGPRARVTGFTLCGGRDVQGGGILVFPSSTAEIDHNLILRNGARNVGSGIFVAETGTPWIHHNIVWENFDIDLDDPGDPHGIQFFSSGGMVEHNVVGRGDSNGIFTNTSAVTIRNNILFENGIAGVRGRGICAVGGARPVIAHNLFFGNKISAILVAPGVGDFSGVEANELSTTDGVYGNLDGDPRFVDIAAHDWHLETGSPAIDAGDPASPLDPDGTWADIGAHDFPHAPTGLPENGASTLRMAVFPNPAVASTWVRYELARPGHARITVHDLAGRRVALLLDAFRPRGVHEAVWTGESDLGARLPSGVYLIRIQVEGGSGTRKVVLAR